MGTKHRVDVTVIRRRFDMSYNGLPPKQCGTRSPSLYSPPPPPVDSETARTAAIRDLVDAQREKQDKDDGSGWFWGGLFLGSLFG